jgi:hypothetical protein
MGIVNLRAIPFQSPPIFWLLTFDRQFRNLVEKRMLGPGSARRIAIA